MTAWSSTDCSRRAHVRPRASFTAYYTALMHAYDNNIYRVRVWTWTCASFFPSPLFLYRYHCYRYRCRRCSPPAVLLGKTDKVRRRLSELPEKKKKRTFSEISWQPLTIICFTFIIENRKPLTYYNILVDAI